MLTSCLKKTQENSIRANRNKNIITTGNPTELVVQAQELRLKAKELAAQLLETRNNDDLIGFVALPTSFVNLNDFSESNSLGRYMSESMIYEFNQRGFPIKEYRIDSKIHMNELAKGEFALTRNLPPLSTNQAWSAILVGTYLKENNTIFINVRLIRAKDGLILRTAQTVLTENALLKQMTQPSNSSSKAPFSSGTINISSEKNTTSYPPIIIQKEETTISTQKSIIQPIDDKTKNIQEKTPPKPGFAKNL